MDKWTQTEAYNLTRWARLTACYGAWSFDANGLGLEAGACREKAF